MRMSFDAQRPKPTINILQYLSHFPGLYERERQNAITCVDAVLGDNIPENSLGKKERGRGIAEP